MSEWNVIQKRPMDDDERAECSEWLGYDIADEDAYTYTNLPDEGEVIVCTEWGHVYIDEFCQDEWSCWFDENGDMDGIVAWMPMPEPYKGKRSEE